MSKKSFNNIKDFGEPIYFDFGAKRESQLSVNDYTKFFKASENFISGIIDLAYNQAVDAFDNFYDSVSKDPEETEDDLSVYRELITDLKNVDMNAFDILYRSSDTFLRSSVPQEVLFFKMLYSGFVEE